LRLLLKILPILFLTFITCVYGKTDTVHLANHCICTTTKDDSDRITRREILNKDGQVVSLEEVAYLDNAFTIKDHAYYKGKVRHVAVSYYEKNPKGLVTKRILGVGSDHEQISSYSYDEAGAIRELINPKGVKVVFQYDSIGILSQIRSSDGTIFYTLKFSDEGLLTTNQINGDSVFTEYDDDQNVTKERFPNGHVIAAIYNKEKKPLTIKLSNHGEIRNRYSSNTLTNVQRISNKGELLYESSYQINDKGINTHQSLIGGIGNRTYDLNDDAHTIELNTPFVQQKHHFNPNTIDVETDGIKISYPYDNLNQLILDSAHDSLGNPINAQVNERHELLSYRNIKCFYDANGNMVKKVAPGKTTEYTYDAFDRLICISMQNQKIHFSYDFFGRRLTKQIHRKGQKTQKRSYLYYHKHEIGICDSRGKIEQLRIPGEAPIEAVSTFIAIETPKGVYAPIYGLSSNVLKLINIKTLETISYTKLDPFAENLKEQNPITPWIYAFKHFDRESNLIYFGSRYYDPEIRRWLTLDPMGRIQTANLYNYVMNNPIIAIDVDGNSSWKAVIPILTFGSGRLVLAALPGIGPAIGAAALALGVYKTIKYGIDTYQTYKKNVDPTLPKDPFNHPDWQDITHPDARDAGHFEFKNKKTDEEIRYDKGKPGKPGHKSRDHYHRANPRSSRGKKDMYLDKDGNPVPDKSEPSHLYSE